MNVNYGMFACGARSLARKGTPDAPVGLSATVWAASAGYDAMLDILPASNSTARLNIRRFGPPESARHRRSRIKYGGGDESRLASADLGGISKSMPGNPDSTRLGKVKA
jgi:hypothetical protein